MLCILLERKVMAFMKDNLPTSLELKKFNMESLFKSNENKGPLVVLMGKRDIGKSFLVRDLLWYQIEIPIGTVIHGTEEGNGFINV
jgi:hypothetical protein